jgi:hypothetical protein
VTAPERLALVPHAVRSVAVAALVGAGGMGVVLFAVRGLVPALPPGGTPDPDSAAANLLLAGALATPIGAAWMAWRLLEPVASVYRRGGLSLVAGSACVALWLVATPFVNHWFGRAGLLGFAGLALGLAALLARRARGGVRGRES